MNGNVLKQTVRCTLIFFAALGCSCLQVTNAQKVGIGTQLPLHTLHLRSPDSNLLVLENRNQLNANIRASLYFKTLNYYTGAVKAIGENTAAARLGFFTFADADSSKLRERMTILDNGRVGIGTISPVDLLDVNGRGRFITSNSFTAAVTGINSGPDNFLFAGVRGISSMMGVEGQAQDANGIGVMGFNLAGSAALATFPFGVGVVGYSNANHGMFGRTSASGSAGVVGSAYGNGAIGGYFSSGDADGHLNTLALRTVGPVRMTAIGEGAGKVLTSDANGNASWQQPATTAGFSAYLSSDFSPTHSVTFDLGAMTEVHDRGNMFTNGASSFTAPTAGLYQVILNARLSLNSVNSKVFIDSQFRINGVVGVQRTLSSEFMDGESGTTLVKTHSNSRLLSLQAGDEVKVNMTVNYLAGTVLLKGGNFAGTTVLSVFKVN